jgi:hypothetical protein
MFTSGHASGGIALVKSDSQKREDEVLLRMLKRPPKPHIEMKLKSRGSAKDSKAAE